MKVAQVLAVMSSALTVCTSIGIARRGVESRGVNSYALFKGEKM